MHGIIKPIDKVFSIVSPEWHGLADVVPSLDRETIKSLLFPIVTGTIAVTLDGIAVIMGNHKALVADMRSRVEDFAGTEWEAGLVPLHIPKQSYRPIENGELWDAMVKALHGVDATVSCVGTLEAGKKFFISADLNGHNELKGPRADKFLCNLNFITSHDGTLGVQAYDSTVRIVCMNTLRWSLNAAGEVGFKVYHTQKADVAMANLGNLVNQVLIGRAAFTDAMGYLDSVACDAETARLVALGYLTSLNADKGKLSTRTRNAADEIALLFARGQGNRGATLYDLLNGATEYWTSGSGTGKTGDAASKAYRGQFGTAADHKNDFCNLLMGGADAIAKAKEAGKKADSLVIHADTAIA